MGHLVLVGGGHAHLMTLAAIPTFVGRGHQVTVVGAAAEHYYSGMGAGLLGGTYQAAELRFATQKAVERLGGRFILDRAVAIEPGNRRLALASGRSLSYDLLSVNVGSEVSKTLPRPIGAADIFPVKPIAGLAQARERILTLAGRAPLTVAIAGGGPSAVEVAGNLRQLGRGPGLKPLRIVIYAGRELLARFPARVRLLTARSLRRRGIDIVHQRLLAIDQGQVMTETGNSPADVVFLASGVEPPSLFRDAGLDCGPDGGLLVNRFLQAVAEPRIFGGGDCISFAPQPLDKVGVYAVRQNPILCHNLLAALEGDELRAFRPGGGYLLIFNLGDGQGLLHRGGLSLDGRLAFWLKDLIDRRFMRRFQAMEGE